MTIGDYSDLLAAGMIKSSGEMRRELDTVVVRNGLHAQFRGETQEEVPTSGLCERHSFPRFDGRN